MYSPERSGARDREEVQEHPLRRAEHHQGGARQQVLRTHLLRSRP